MGASAKIVALSGSALILVGQSAVAQDRQLKANMDVAFETIFATCPSLVSVGSVPANFELAVKGLKTSSVGLGDWQGKFDDGVLIVDFDPAKRTCATNLSSGSYERFGKFVIEQLQAEGYQVLVDRRQEAVPGAVLAKFSPDKTRRAQFTVVMNPTGPLLTVSYTEKANF